jgi:hypothetical protein
MLACCQGLVSPGVQLVQASIKFTPLLLGLQLVAVDPLVDFGARQTPTVGTEYDIGPPCENCFVETVLKRSLPENAPPLFA